MPPFQDPWDQFFTTVGPIIPIPGGEVEEDPERGVLGSLAHAAGAGAIQTATQTAGDVLGALTAEAPRDRWSSDDDAEWDQFGTTLHGVTESEAAKRVSTAVVKELPDDLETYNGWFDSDDAERHNTRLGSRLTHEIWERNFKGNKLIDIGAAPADRRSDPDVWLNEVVEQSRANWEKNFPDTPWTDGAAQKVRSKVKNAALAKNFLVSGEGYSRGYHAGFWQMPIENMEKLALEMHDQAETTGTLKRGVAGKIHQRVMRGIESLVEAGEYHSDVSLDAYRKQSDPERKHRRELIRSMEMIRRGVDPAASENMAFRGLLGAAEMAPAMLAGGAMGKIVGGTVAAAAGSRVGQAMGLTGLLETYAARYVPGGLVPGAAEALGGTAGGLAGGTLFWGSIESVDIGESIRANGGSDELANTMAATGGLLIGAMEYFQYLLLGGLYKGGKEAMMPARDAVRKTVTNYAKGLTGLYAAEVTTEMAQAVTALGSRALAVHIGHLKGLEWPEEFEALAEELREVALAMPWIMGPGAVRKYQRHNVFNRKLTERELAGKQKAQEIQALKDRAEKARLDGEQARRESSERGAAEETERVIQEEEARAREDEDMQLAIAADEQTRLLGMGYGMAAETAAAEKEAKRLEWNERKAELERGEQHQAMLERERQGREAEAKAVDKDVEIAAGQVAEQVITGMQEDPDFHDAVTAFMEAEPSRKAAQAVVIPDNLKEQLGDTLLDSLRSREARQHFIDQFKRQRLVSEERPSPSLADVQDGDTIHFKNAKGDLETGTVLERGPGRAWLVKTAANPDGQIIFHKDITIRRGRPGEAVEIPEVPRPTEVEVEAPRPGEAVEPRPVEVSEADLELYRESAARHFEEMVSGTGRVVANLEDAVAMASELRSRAGKNAGDAYEQEFRRLWEQQAGVTPGAEAVQPAPLVEAKRQVQVQRVIDAGKKVRKAKARHLETGDKIAMDAAGAEMTSALGEENLKEFKKLTIWEKLEVLPSATLEKTEEAFRKKQRLFHPDVHAEEDNDLANAWMKVLNLAVDYARTIKEFERKINTLREEFGDSVEFAVEALETVRAVPDGEINALLHHMGIRGKNNKKRSSKNRAVVDVLRTEGLEARRAAAEAKLREKYGDVAGVQKEPAQPAQPAEAEAPTVEQLQKRGVPKSEAKRIVEQQAVPEVEAEAAEVEAPPTEAVPEVAPAAEGEVTVFDVSVEGTPLRYKDWLIYKPTGQRFQVGHAWQDTGQTSKEGKIIPSIEPGAARLPSEITTYEVERTTDPKETAAPTPTPAAEEGVGEYQEEHQEELVHSRKEWKVNAFRYVLEGTGDVLRESDKWEGTPIGFRGPALGYIDGKLRRLETFIAAEESGPHPDDSYEKAARVDKETLLRFREMWENQPTETKLQELAVELNIAVIDGDFSKATDLIAQIREEGQRLIDEGETRRKDPTPTPAAVTPAAAAVSMEPVAADEQVKRNAERRKVRRQFALEGDRAVKNAEALRERAEDPQELERMIREGIELLEDDNPGIIEELDDGLFDPANNRIISPDGTIAVVFENDGNINGNFAVETYAPNETSNQGLSPRTLFMTHAANMSEADYNDRVLAGRKNELPSHREVVEWLVRNDMSDKVSQAARESHPDLAYAPPKYAGIPNEVFSLETMAGEVKKGVTWGAQKVKDFYTKYFTWPARMGKTAKLAQDQEKQRVASELNEARNLYDDLGREVKQEYGVALDSEKMDQGVKEQLTEALSDPVVRAGLPTRVGEALSAMRDHIMALSHRLIESGRLTEGMELIFDENMEAYLHRSYRGIEDPNWATEVRENRPELVENAKDLMQEQNHQGQRKSMIGKIIHDIKRLGRKGRKATVNAIDADLLTNEEIASIKEAQKWKPTEEQRKKMTRRQIKDERASRVDAAVAQVMARVKPQVEQIIADNQTDLSDDVLEGRVEALLYRLKGMGKYPGTNQGSVRANEGILKLRKDIDKAILELYGEYTDVGLVYARSVHKMANLLAKDKFQKDLAAIMPEDMLSDKADRVETPIGPLKGSEWGAMEGLYASPHLITAIEESFGRGAEFGWLARHYFKAVSGAKAAKTIYSVVTTIRNLVSNGTFAFIHGHFRINNWRTAFKYGWYHMAPDVAPGMYNRKKPDHQVIRDFVNNMVARGVLENSLAKEMTSVIEEAWAMDFNEYALADGASRENLARKIQRKLGRRGRKIHAGAAAIYQAMDEIPKMVGFMGNVQLLKEAYPEMSQEEIEDQAAERVKNQYPTWSRVSSAVQSLRRWSFHSTFPTFVSELYRTTYHTFRQAKEDIQSGNPRLRKHGYATLIRFAGASYGAKVAFGVMSTMLGVDDEEREALDRHQPPWSRHSTNVYWKDKDGNARSIDMSHNLPHMMLLDPLNALFESDVSMWDRFTNAAAEVAEPFTSEEMVASKIIDLARGKKLMGGEIFNPEDTDGEKTWAMVKHLWQPWEPGTVSTGVRIWKGIINYEEKSGRVYSAPLELLAGLGLRVNVMNPRISLRYKSINFNRRIRDANRRVSSVAYSGQTGSSGRLEGRLETSDKARRHIYHEMHKDLKAAYVLGLSEGDVYRIMRDNGVSDANARLILRDSYAPQRFQNSQLRNIYESNEGKDKLDVIRKWQQGLRE